MPRAAAKWAAMRERRQSRAPVRGNRTKAPRRRRLGRIWPLLVLGVVVYLYYRPIASWLHSRNALAERTEQVRILHARESALERDVARATSLKQLSRQARRIGLVRPGEQLFIVKGIPAWERAHGAR